MYKKESSNLAYFVKQQKNTLALLGNINNTIDKRSVETIKVSCISIREDQNGNIHVIKNINISYASNGKATSYINNV